MSVVAILATSALAGCGGDSVTGLDEGFDAGMAASLVEAAASSEWVNLATGHASLIVLAVKNARPVASVIPGLDDDRLGAVGRRSGVSLGGKLTAAASVSFSATGRNGSLPDEALGKTYTLVGQTAGGYAIDEDASDAPTDGARFKLYELDHGTGQPKLVPVSRAGQLDLTEPVPLAGLNVMATDKGGNLLADLTLSRTVVENPTSRESTMTSSGTLVRRNPFDFTFLDHVSIADGFSRIDFEFDRELRSEDRDIRVTFDTDGYISFSEADPGLVRLLMTVESDGHTVAIDVVDDGTFANGTVTYDGKLMVSISGDNVVPTFAHPDGTLLEGPVLDDMWELWNAYDFMLFFGDELLIPLSTLIL